MLKKFYAVTKTSVYYVRIDLKLGSPELTKIALRGDSRIPVGGKITDGTMLSVGEQLIPFIPEGGGVTSFRREIAMVNTRWWGTNTSDVVALFLCKNAALTCHKAKRKKPCDNRWRKETIGVLRAIGKEHPHCSVSTDPSCRLMSPENWQ